jgi:proteasome lid subunit RPN8/RPN11
MTLVLFTTLESEIRKQLELAYPEEGCGLLLGRVEGERKIVVHAEGAKNNKESERTRRYLIGPEEYERISKLALSQNLEILGIYHSHPDHPSRPSDFDRDAAWPWYSYIVVAVAKGVSKELTSWTLASDRSRFDVEQIERE